MTGSGLAYLHTSAFVKLIAPERESRALDAELRRWPRAVASELLEIEARRFATRFAGTAARLIEAALPGITLIPIRAEIRTLAAAMRPPELRTLDAIHLATALTLGPQLETFFSYDRRLLEAAQLNELSVQAPV